MQRFCLVILHSLVVGYDMAVEVQDCKSITVYPGFVSWKCLVEYCNAFYGENNQHTINILESQGMYNDPGSHTTIKKNGASFWMMINPY